MRPHLVNALCVSLQAVRRSSARPLDAERLDVEICELIGLVADLRAGRSVAGALEQTHDRILAALNASHLMQTSDPALAKRGSFPTYKRGREGRMTDAEIAYLEKEEQADNVPHPSHAERGRR